MENDGPSPPIEDLDLIRSVLTIQSMMLLDMYILLSSADIVPKNDIPDAQRRINSTMEHLKKTVPMLRTLTDNMINMEDGSESR
ncbi:hypothetical protein [Komagataeibacter rhaeticus]|uniref:hypothetical protein n=1 Tax=Komagataeibacter rhaeticus TaxID=215221 RepID=UPI001A490F9A|nr:hypothetical protein [Komagataeibacter rhaeticus]MBL7239148.1 hypothetical protein [Komagataeibacter rhaeticus]